MKLNIDSRDKKPNLYPIAFLTAAAAAALAVVYGLPGSPAPGIAGGILCLSFLAALILLLRAFFGQLEYNPYSYNTIYYVGFALFLLSVLATQVYVTVMEIRYPTVYTQSQLLSAALGAPQQYMLLSAPFLLVFSVALCVSNLSLIRHEGRRPVNLLGILLSFLLIAGEAVLFRFDFYASGSLAEVRRHALIANTYAAVYLYFECMLIGAIIANAIAVGIQPKPDRDFLIVLGCGLRKDGTPTPLLRGRLDRALAFARRQKEETGKDLTFITSGGQGPNEVISESASMKQYLLDQGVPAERIVEEDRSRDTMENMRFSREKIQAMDPAGKVAFATTNYHVFRSGLCARRVKMRALGLGAPTKWYFWPNASVREFVGLLTEHRGKQALVLGGLILLNVVLTLVVYRQ